MEFKPKPSCTIEIDLAHMGQRVQSAQDFQKGKLYNPVINQLRNDTP